MNCLKKLKYRSFEIIQRNKKKKEWKSEFWDIIRRSNLSIEGVSEGELAKKGAENLFKEKVAKKFPNLGTDFNIQFHEGNKSPQNLNNQTPRHTIILNKIKKKKRGG